MKYVLKALATRARSAAWAARADGREDGDGLRILFYHRVSDDRDELAVSPRDFRRQMDYLATESYRVVDVVEAAELLDTGRLVPPDGRAQLRRRVPGRGRAGAAAARRARLPGDRLRRAGGRRRVGDVRLVPLAAAGARLGRDRRPRPRGDAPLRGALAHASRICSRCAKPQPGRRSTARRSRSRSTSSVQFSRFPTLPGSSGLANVDSSPQPGSTSRSRASPDVTRAAQTVSRCVGVRSTGATACWTSARSSAAATIRPSRSVGCIAAAVTAWERAACASRARGSRAPGARA